MNTQKLKTVAITPPSWRTAVQIYAQVIVSGSNGAATSAGLELRRCAAIADACGPLFDEVLAALLCEDAGKVPVTARLRALMKDAERVMTRAGCFVGDNARPRE